MIYKYMCEVIIMSRRPGQFVRCILLVLLFNCVAWWGFGGYTLIKILATAALAVHFLVFLAVPQLKKRGERTTPQLTRLANGACILGYGRLFIWLELLIIILLAVFGGLAVWRNIVNGLIAYLFIFLLNVSGIIRLAVSSKQVKIPLYVILLFTWYIPVINSLVLRKFYKTARSEYRFEQAKFDLDDMRVESQVCKTRYPILMVHGIFFRDWQIFNYWGRIPRELVKNGAMVFYGSQQSSNSIEQSARELSAQITHILEQTGAEKLNIIAHSKGGLDCRYAISRLGMDKYVASLTTINTPHRGCAWVDNVLEKAPKGLAEWLDRKYNGLFMKLGDRDPHFLVGVKELTAAACEKFNAETPDMPNVRYNSVMSRMVTPLAAGFPLNIGYFLGKKYDKQGNDGLVGFTSGLYGSRTTVIPDTRKRGISHGDVIDLMRENIDGFDVREFYVKMVRELKEEGL